MREKRGWWLPHDDGYFDKFIEDAGGYKRNGFQREHLLEAFKWVRDWSMAVDVGAHVGLWTRDMAEKFQSVFAFEAAADTFACLAKNTADLQNVRAHNVAIGHKEGKVVIMRDSKRQNQSGSRWVMPVNEDGNVAMITIDSLKLKSCGLLKIDVEGFELFVLQGAASTIHRYRPVIIMETDKHFSEKRYQSQSKKPISLVTNEWNYVEKARMRPDRVFVPREFVSVTVG